MGTGWLGGTARATCRWEMISRLLTAMVSSPLAPLPRISSASATGEGSSDEVWTGMAVVETEAAMLC